MSDTFDHGSDAWESYDRASDEGYHIGHPRRSTSRRSPRPTFSYDPLHYHRRLAYTRIVESTDRAVRLEVPDTPKGTVWIWLPRSVCRNWTEREVWVHKPTYAKSLDTAQTQVDLEAMLSRLANRE